VTRPRDSQRSKVYRAEAIWRGSVDWSRMPLSSGQLWTLHDKLVNDGEYAKLVRVPVECLRQVRFEVTAKRTRYSGFAWEWGGEDLRIVMAKIHLDMIVTRLSVYVHELAHAAQYLRTNGYEGEAFHGPEFAGTMLRTTEYVIGDWARGSLALAYLSGGVKISYSW